MGIRPRAAVPLPLPLPPPLPPPPPLVEMRWLLLLLLLLLLRGQAPRPGSPLRRQPGSWARARRDVGGCSRPARCGPGCRRLRGRAGCLSTPVLIVLFCVDTRVENNE